MKMAECAVLLGLLICASPVTAQSVQQSGTVTPGHVATWLTTGVIGDGGVPGGPIFTGSTTQNDFACVGSGSPAVIIDCGLSATGVNNWTAQQNFNGGITVSGAITLNVAPLTFNSSTTLPTPATQGLLINGTITGTSASASGYTANATFLQNNAILTSPNASFIGQAITCSIGGGAASGMQGNTVCLNVATGLNAATINTAGQYVGIVSTAQANSNDGGGSGTERGAFFAYGCNAYAAVTGVHIQELTCGEMDVAAVTGTTVLYKAGFSSVLFNPAAGGDAVHGTDVDAGFAVGSWVGTALWNTAYLVTGWNGSFPVSATGVVLGVDSGPAGTIGSVYRGVDFGKMKCSGDGNAGFLVTSNSLAGGSFGYGTLIHCSGAIELRNGGATNSVAAGSAWIGGNASSGLEGLVLQGNGTGADIFMADRGGNGGLALITNSGAPLIYIYHGAQFAGTSSGQTTLKSNTSAATGTINIPSPAGTDTMAVLGLAQTFTASQTLSAALVYGGVTLSNSVVGTGSMVLSTSPTFTTSITSAVMYGGAAANSNLLLIGTSNGSPSGDSLAIRSSTVAFQTNGAANDLIINTAVSFTTCTALTTSSSTLACTASASRYKNIFQDESPTLSEASQRLDKVRDGVPVWSYRDEYQKEFGAGIRVGLIADDVEAMDSRCVTYDDNGKLKDYWDRCVIAYLVADRKQLKSRIDRLESQNR
jgi:hypothetical protein